MTPRFDSIADTNYQQFYKLADIFGIPDYVKQAKLEDALHPQELPASAYADPILKQFPCHNKAACYVSALFCAANSSYMPVNTFKRASQGIYDNAKIFKNIEDVAVVFKTAEKNAAASSEADSEYAFVITGDDGIKHRKYPLRNAAEVTKAAEWLQEYRDVVPFEIRHKLANAICDKAEQFNIELPESLDVYIVKQAARGTCDAEECARLLDSRASVKHLSQPIKTALHKLSAAFRDEPMLALESGVLFDLASKIDAIDNSFNLRCKYSAAFPRSEDVLFKGMHKYAQSFLDNTCATLTGSVYDKDQFASLSLDTVRQNFGDDMANEVSSGFMLSPQKMATVASTLPLPDAMLLDRLMAKAGQQPALSKAGGVGPAADELQQLAIEYKLTRKNIQPLGLVPSGLR